MQCREKKFAKYAKKAAKGLCVHLDGAAKVLKLLHKYVKKDAARPLMGARKAAARLLQGRRRPLWLSCRSFYGLFEYRAIFFYLSFDKKKRHLAQS